MLVIWPERFPSLLYIFSWIFTASLDSPLSCVRTSSNVTSLVSCLDGFTVTHEYYDLATYEAAQPTESQRDAWTSVVTSVLSVDGNCSSVVVPGSLAAFYSVHTFLDGDVSYCVLAESSITECGVYKKGWGHLIVPATRSAVSRSIHLSAPHPQYDRGTMEQAAALFKFSGAKSLLLAGRIRTAFLYPSSCVKPSSSNQHYYETDPAHNNREPFVDASLAIHTWQHKNGGCPSASCAFIQVHGKAPSTCALDQIFISTGLGHSTASKNWYTSPINHPVKRLKRNLRRVFPAWNISLPSDSNCILTATKNVVGRYINGVDEFRVCFNPARIPGVIGEFVHVEQDAAARSEESYGLWSLALQRSFETTCAPGMSVNPLSEMCAPDSMFKGVEEGGGESHEESRGVVDSGFFTKWVLWTSLLNVL